MVSLRAGEGGLPQTDPDTLCATGSRTPQVPPALLDGFPCARPAPTPLPDGREPRGLAARSFRLPRPHEQRPGVSSVGLWSSLALRKGVWAEGPAEGHVAGEPWSLLKNFLFLSPKLSGLGRGVKGAEWGKHISVCGGQAFTTT